MARSSRLWRWLRRSRVGGAFALPAENRVQFPAQSKRKQVRYIQVISMMMDASAR